MADENLPPEPDAPTTGAPTGPPQEAPQEPALGDSGQKALAAERKRANDAARSLKAMETRLKEFEDRDKSEAEKLAEARTAAEKQAADATSALTRYQVALRHGISEDDFDLLGDGTPEQIEARATKLAALKAAATPADAVTAPNKRPTESLKPGATPAADVPDGEPNAYPPHWIPGGASS